MGNRIIHAIALVLGPVAFAFSAFAQDGRVGEGAGSRPEGVVNTINRPQTPLPPVTLVAPPPPTTATAPAADPSTNAFGQVCLQMLQGLLGGQNSATAKLMAQIADDENDKIGFAENKEWNRANTAEIADARNVNYPKGCENRFIDKEGRLGPYGRTALAEIKSKPNSYVNNVPSDFATLCPRYKGMDNEKREQFWVWAFSSLAAPESSCNPNAANPNAPNGTAKGLFQLEKPLCDRFGETGNLYNGHVNVRCAVRALASELRKRDTLTLCKRGTYWGPLRCDDNNKARGGDIKGGMRFRALVSKFPGCK